MRLIKIDFFLIYKNAFYDGFLELMQKVTFYSSYFNNLCKKSNGKIMYFATNFKIATAFWAFSGFWKEPP